MFPWARRPVRRRMEDTRACRWRTVFPQRGQRIPTAGSSGKLCVHAGSRHCLQWNAVQSEVPPVSSQRRPGLDNFVSLIRTYFDRKGSHMQFNVVSRETLLDAQKHRKNYRHLVVRVAGYSRCLPLSQESSG